MIRRSTVLGVTVWAVTVVVVAAVTWRVIDAAGRDVLVDSPPAVTGATGPTAGPTTSASPGAPSGTPVRSHRPTPSVRPTAAASSAPPRATGHPAPTSQRPNPAPTRSTPPPAPAGVTGSWRGAAGTVTVRCVGAKVELRAATPANGYRTELEQEDSAVQVTFKRDQPREVEVQVRATCPGGQPRFGVEGSGGGGDD